MPIVQQALLFLLLMAVIGAGWWRETRRAQRGETELPVMVRGLLLLATTGGAFGAVAWFALVPDTFAWVLPPLANRFLSAASAAFAVGCGLALWRGRWPEAQLMLVITLGYFLPLLATLPLHLDRFDVSQAVSWGFFVAGVGMPVLAAVGLRQSRGAVPREGRAAPLEGWMVGMVVVVGLLSLVLGLLMVLAPALSLSVWPWLWVHPAGSVATDGLTTRLVAVMLVGMAAGAGFTLWRNRGDVALVYLAMQAAYGVVAAAAIILFLRDRPATPGMYIYLAELTLVALASIAGVVRARSG